MIWANNQHGGGGGSGFAYCTQFGVPPELIKISNSGEEDCNFEKIIDLKFLSDFQGGIPLNFPD